MKTTGDSRGLKRSRLRRHCFLGPSPVAGAPSEVPSAPARVAAPASPSRALRVAARGPSAPLDCEPLRGCMTRSRAAARTAARPASAGAVFGSPPGPSAPTSVEGTGGGSPSRVGEHGALSRVFPSGCSGRVPSAALRARPRSRRSSGPDPPASIRSRLLVVRLLQERGCVAPVAGAEAISLRGAPGGGPRRGLPGPLTLSGLPVPQGSRPTDSGAQRSALSGQGARSGVANPLRRQGRSSDFGSGWGAW